MFTGGLLSNHYYLKRLELHKEVVQNCCALNAVLKAYYGFSIYRLQPQPCNLSAVMVWFISVSEFMKKHGQGYLRK